MRAALERSQVKFRYWIEATQEIYIDGEVDGCLRVFLRETVEAVGEAGEIVNVDPAYARDTLLPLGKAFCVLPATSTEIIQKELQGLSRSLQNLRMAFDGVAPPSMLEAGDIPFGSRWAEHVQAMLDSPTGLAMQEQARREWIEEASDDAEHALDTEIRPTEAFAAAEIAATSDHVAAANNELQAALADFEARLRRLEAA